MRKRIRNIRAFLSSLKSITPIELKKDFLPPQRGRIKVGGKIYDVHPHPNLPPHKGEEMR